MAVAFPRRQAVITAVASSSVSVDFDFNSDGLTWNSASNAAMHVIVTIVSSEGGSYTGVLVKHLILGGNTNIVTTITPTVQLDITDNTGFSEAADASFTTPSNGVLRVTLTSNEDQLGLDYLVVCEGHAINTT